MNEIVNQINKLEKDISEKQKNIIELQQSKVDHKKKRHTLNEKKRKLLTQAEQMKSPNNTTEIPDVNMIQFRLWRMSCKRERKKSSSIKEKTSRERFTSRCLCTIRPKKQWVFDQTIHKL